MTAKAKSAAGNVRDANGVAKSPRANRAVIPCPIDYKFGSLDNQSTRRDSDKLLWDFVVKRRPIAKPKHSVCTVVSTFAGIGIGSTNARQGTN